MNVRGRATWLPALLIGAAGAIAAEVAVALLLYAGPGLMRSLTTVLAVEAAAFAAGLQTAPDANAHLVDAVRRRWVFCLVAFGGAAIFGTLWSMIDTIGEGRVGQGAGLTLLAGLPMFGCGAVLGGIGTTVARIESGSRGRPSASAALGAALGFMVTGALLPRAPIPASLLVGCLVLVSGAGMLFGAMFEVARVDAAAAATVEPFHGVPPDVPPEAIAIGSVEEDPTPR